MSSNGRLSAGELAPISGGGRLRKDAARSWNAFARMCLAEHNFRVSVTDSYRELGRPGDLARGHWSQWAAWEKMKQGGNLAATPGRSNHGAGTALDLPPDTVEAVRKWGDPMGWNHAHSDAPSESWHHLFLPSQADKRLIDRWSVKSGEPVLRPGDRDPSVKVLKERLIAWNCFGRLWPRTLGYGGRTVGAVKKFQRLNHMNADGVVGPATWKKLHERPPVKRRPVKVAFKHFADVYEGDQINLREYQRAGHQVIAMKATEGVTYRDSEFSSRWALAGALGLTRWAYHYARPGTKGNTPQAEAANFATVVKAAGPIKSSDRFVLDWEDEKFTSNGDEWVRSFIGELAHRGITLRVIYGGGYYIAETLSVWPSDSNGHALRYWHAQYSSTPESAVPPMARPFLRAVQFTDKKKCPGISNPCDYNYFV